MTSPDLFHTDILKKLYIEILIAGLLTVIDYFYLYCHYSEAEACSFKPPDGTRRI